MGDKVSSLGWYTRYEEWTSLRSWARENAGATRLTSRISLMSAPLRTNEAAMKSISLGTPQLTMSSMSLSSSTGRSTITPGRLTFFLSPSIALLITRARTVPVCRRANEPNTRVGAEGLDMERGQPTPPNQLPLTFMSALMHCSTIDPSPMRI